MKLVHKPLTRWFSVGCALFALFALTPAKAQQPEYLQHFDPAKGFKSAEPNLTRIMLQIAGSLECYGSPEPYLRHMQQEHARVSRLFEAKMGKQHNSRMPSHMTDAYVDRFVKNWNVLSAPLGLDAFTKEIGRCMREGIMGTRSSGTMAVEIFNQHQKLVVAKMRGENSAEAGFDELKARLVHDLEFDKETVDTLGYETTRRDAVRYTLVIKDRFTQMFEKVDSIAATPQKAEQIKQSITEWFLDLGYLAQSELEIGILDSGLNQH